MKKSTPTKSIWSQKDLQEYLAEAASAYKVGRGWPTVLNMLIKGGGEDDSDQPEIPHPASSLAVTRRIQIVREYLSAIPRRRLVDGTKGKTIIPFKAILHTVSGILQTPLIKDDVVSLGSQGSATSPQAKGMEAKLTAGDSTADGGAIASTPDVTKALPVQAGAASPGAESPAAFPQITGVDEATLPQAMGMEEIKLIAGNYK